MKNIDSSLESLPREVLLHIFSYLPLKDRIILTRVSSWFEEVLNQLWSTQSRLSFQYSDKPVFDNNSSLLVRGMDENRFTSVATEILSKCPQLKHVYFSRPFDGSILGQFNQQLTEIASQDMGVISEFVKFLYTNDLQCKLGAITFVRGFRTNMFKHSSLDFLAEVPKLKHLSLDLPSTVSKTIVPTSVVEKLNYLSVNGIEMLKRC